MENLLVRLLVAVIVAAVIVWLLGLTTIPSMIVGLIALVAFLLILFSGGVGSRL